MHYLKQELQKVYLQLDKILLLFASLFFLVEVIWAPINSFLAELLLQWTGHAYLSPTNLLEVLLAKWWVTILFVLLVVVNLLLAYFQVGFIFVSVRTLLDEEVKHLRETVAEVGRKMLQLVKNVTVSKVLFLLLYATLFFPFLRRVLQIYYFNKLVLPQFILDYLTQTLWQAIVIATWALFLFWLAIRWMYALPQIYFEQATVGDALRYSWQRTRGKAQVVSYLRLAWVMVQAGGFFLVVSGLLYGLQLLFDLLSPTLSFILAVGQYILLQLTYYGALAMFMTKFVGMLTDKHLPFYRRQRLRQRLRLTIVLSASLYFGLQGALYLYFPFDTLPLTISHRGVDEGNGVQNTVDSLEKTARLKPDYIEMDIQETKDGQFVVMHDTDLEALTGYPGGTHDYTLAEMQEMMASENGLSSPVPSFDDYLDKADQLGQKLLVEIKVTTADSPEMMRHFLDRYGRRLLAQGHRLHSLDYDVIIKAKEALPQLNAAFILPYNSIYPTTIADAYTMEYSSLDQSFIIKSWLRHKQVYAWTPNEEESMLEMVQLQVDGIITDNLTTLQNLEDGLARDRNYSSLLSLQIQSLLYPF